MSVRAPSAAIFDLDGTLVDSHAEIASTLDAALTECGFPHVGPLLRSAIGPPLDTLLRELLPHADDAARARVRTAFTRRYDTSDFTATLVFPGVREALALLTARGVTVFVATAKRDAPTRRLLAQLALGPFRDVACVDSLAGAARSKSELVGGLVETHALERGRTWMIGDTASDLRAARDHGLAAIAAAYGYGSPESIRAERPDATLASSMALLELVGGALGGVRS